MKKTLILILSVLAFSGLAYSATGSVTRSFGVYKGTMTDEKVCTYETTGNQIVCNEAETGTGSIVRATTPTLVTPEIGAATGTSLVLTTNALIGAATLHSNVTDVSGTPVLGLVGGNTTDKIVIVQTGANNSTAVVEAFKTRSSTTSADTTIVTGDGTLSLRGWAAEGDQYRPVARINMTTEGTIADNATPGNIIMLTRPAAAAANNNLTEAFRINSYQNSIFTGTITSTSADNLGWTPVNAANQACATTCTNACVIGQDTSALGNFLGCADAASDTCVCAGAS